jgi:O-antigen ligase
MTADYSGLGGSIPVEARDIRRGGSDIPRDTIRPGPRRLPVEYVVAVTAWVLIVVNVQPWVKPPSGPQGQAAVESTSSKGVLMAAIFMVAVLLAAPQFRIRMPPTYLFYFGYVFVAAATAFHLSDPVPPLLRVGRLGLAIAIPLLLWRWLAGRPSLFLGSHRTAHLLVGIVVFAGLAAVPSAAWDRGGSFSGGGRLQGVFLPMLPPRVGEIGAIVVGLTAIGLTFKRTGPLSSAILIGLGLALIILSRTRTAAAALLIGLFVAFCLTRKHRLGRRALRTILVLVLLGIPLLTPIRSWAIRDQDAQQVSSFTGRTHAWSAVLDQQSSWRTVTLGHGLGNKRILLRRGEGDIDVMAIDNGWLSLFWETGLLGATLVLLALIAAIITVFRAPTPYVRAAASFLIVYVAIASFTETGLSDLSSQTLHVLVATAAAHADWLLVRGQEPLLQPLAPAQHQSLAGIASRT